MIDTNIAASENGTTHQVQSMTTEYEIRDVLLEESELNNGVAYSAKVWRLYEQGVWEEVDDLEVRCIVANWLKTHEDNITNFRPGRALESNITELIKTLRYVRPKEWDKYPNILVFQNSALDILPESGVVVEVDHNPSHMATVALPYDYDPSKEAQTWNRILNDLLSKEEAEFFQEFAGYCLTTSVKHQMALWLVGPPGGGKSTLITGLETMLGEKSDTLGQTQLQGSRFSLGHIPGKTLLACTENPGGSIKITDTLNALITGDTVQVERKYKDAGKYRNTAKLLWSMNKLPVLFEPNNGLFRRVKILELPAIEGDRDPQIIEDIKLEGPGIINWALEGLTRLNQRGGFDYPQTVLDATERFKKDNDLQARFLEDRCLWPPQATLPNFDQQQYRVRATELADAFNDWLKENHHKGEWSTKSLAPEWRRNELIEGGTQGYKERDSKGKLWYGIKLRK